MEITLYTAFCCPDCRTVKRSLAKHSIPYKEIDTGCGFDAAEEVIRATGKRAIPQLVIAADGR